MNGYNICQEFAGLILDNISWGPGLSPTGLLPLHLPHTLSLGLKITTIRETLTEIKLYE